MNEVTESGRKILYLLKGSESGMTIEGLCQSLQVTPMAVHRPITALQDQGLVASQLLRQKRGRPVRVYRVTETADDLFPKSYGNLILELLEELGASEGIVRIRKLFEARFKKLGRENRGKMKGKDLHSRIEILSQILRENNYIIEVDQVTKKKFIMKLLNCPISKVAKEYPQACTCEQNFMSQLLQADVTRDHHILKGQIYCSYVIQRK